MYYEFEFCKTCHVAMENDYDAGKHYDIIKHDICPLCKNNKKWSYHENSIDLDGIVLECGECHNYVKYYFACLDIKNIGAYKLDREEFWINDYLLIKENNLNKILYYPTRLTICEVPIFEFLSKEDLLKKIKTYITFS